MPNNPSIRLIARVLPIVGRKQAVHSWQNTDSSKLAMPFPDVLLLVSDGNRAMIYRYKQDGTFCGDTWHESIEDAKQQAIFEYQGALQAWSLVPTEEQDAREFAIRMSLVNAGEG
jgi:hypothetical protein